MIGLTWGREQKRQKLGTTTTCVFMCFFLSRHETLILFGWVASYHTATSTKPFSCLHCTDTITHTSPRTHRRLEEPKTAVCGGRPNARRPPTPSGEKKKKDQRSTPPAAIHYNAGSRRPPHEQATSGPPLHKWHIAKSSLV